MEFIPIRTRIMQPPQDDLFAVLDESLVDVRERDVVVVSAKVVAIHEGRCVSAVGVEKQVLAAQDADIVIPRDYCNSPLTITNHAFISSAGIDDSNGNGYMVRLPIDSFLSAERIHAYLVKRFNLKEVAVIVSDSHSEPFRYGATGIAIGFYGLQPLIDHRGTPDIFGRLLRYERTNIIDGIAAGANVVMGETDECQPVVVVRGVPKLTFVAGNQRSVLFVDPYDDYFRVLYERFLTE